jgi:hypothetical protein
MLRQTLRNNYGDLDRIIVASVTHANGVSRRAGALLVWLMPADEDRWRLVRTLSAPPRLLDGAWALGPYDRPAPAERVPGARRRGEGGADVGRDLAGVPNL